MEEGRAAGWFRAARRALVPVLVALVVAGCSGGHDGDDGLSSSEELRAAVVAAGITPLEAGPAHPQAKVELGQLLMFDKVLSGAGNIACATCHHPLAALGDGLSLPFGEGGAGLGRARDQAAAAVIPRNAPEAFNRGAPAWHTMFWDSRVAGDAEHGFVTPAGEALPPGLDSVLAAQAMFPPTSRDEMRGQADDGTDANDLAECADDDLDCVWTGLVARLRGIPEYVDLFVAAFADVDGAEDITFVHVANAIAAFEATAWSFFDAPWDRYVVGDDLALTDQETRGALLFFGEAGCAACHSGNLFTDQAHHNIGAPQIGPGKGAAAPEDLGREAVTGEPADRCAFRTPPLRNVAFTAPYLHSGAYVSLRDAVVHHLDPVMALEQYDVSTAAPGSNGVDQMTPAVKATILAHLDPLVATPIDLTATEIDDLVAFLSALTSSSIFSLPETIPARVPSGCPVAESGATCDPAVLDGAGSGS